MKLTPNLTRRSTLGLLGLGGLGILPSFASASTNMTEPSMESESVKEKLLFFDDDQIANREGVDRIVHEAEKRGEPVVEPTEPWEQTFGSEDLPGNVYVYGTVMYDEDEEVYQLWYTTFTLVEPDFSEYFYSICYATSEDGIEWEKPDLGIVEYEGSTDNNIVYRGSRGHPLSVIRDSPAESEYVASGDAGNLFESPDGLHWDLSDATLPSVNGGPDADFAAYDPSEEEYMSFFRGLTQIGGHERRTQFLSRSDDFEDWSDPTVVLEPDEVDDELVQSYGNEYAGAYHMPVLQYGGGMYVGLLSLIAVGGGSPEQVLLQLAFSRDRESWSRPDRRPKIPLGEDGEFDSSMIMSAAGSGGTGSQPLVVDDKIRVYYGGWDGTHDSNDRGASIGLATWRLDGFASLSNDDDSPGTITTERVIFEDDRLLVNADMVNEGRKNGRLDVEVLDADGNVIEGFDRENCVTVQGDEVDRKINWRGPSNIESLAGEEVQFRVSLEDGNLYSLQFKHERIEYTLDVTVEDEKGGVIEGADVAVDGESATTDADGTAAFDLFNGGYTVSASGDGFEDGSTDVTIDDADATVTLTLEVEETATGPVAHYRLDDLQDDGTVLDASSNELSGTNHGATIVDGKVGNALEFNDGSYVEIEDDERLGLEKLTIAAWVRSEPGAEQYIFDGRGHQYLLNERQHTEQPHLFIYVDGDYHRCIAPSAPDTEWYHVAATYDGSEMRMYINGELVQTNDAPSGPIDTAPGTALIGNWVGDHSYNYDGAIDDLYVYDRALSEEEIGSIFNEGTGGLVAHYPLDEVHDDGTVEDASSNDLRGTNHGATVVDGAVGNAYEFDNGSYVEITDDPILSVEEVTIAAWVSPEEGYQQYIFDGRGHEYLLNERKDTERPQLMIWVDGQFHRCIAPSAPDSEWYHVAATYDGSEMRMYVDGELVQTNDTPSGPIDTSSSAARIGNYILDGSFNYDGIIDDLYVYNRAVSESEIETLRGRGSPPS